MMETTSLNDTTWSTVTTSIMYRCPDRRARKKPPIMMKVHIVRVMKVCFFFSYSFSSAGYGFWSVTGYINTHVPSTPARGEEEGRGACRTFSSMMAPLRMGLPLSDDALSLISLMLWLGLLGRL
jgi:hypothetical protein